MKPIFLGCIATIALSQALLLVWHTHTINFLIALLLFFTAFTILEASLPSLISKIAPAGSKGTAIGVYSSSQFLGIFVGGAGGGWFYSLHGITGVFLLCSIAAVIWFMVAIRMKKPPQLATRMYNIHDFASSDKSAVQEQLNKLTGVHDVYTCEDDDTLYLKIDSQSFNENDLESMGYQTNIQD